MASVPPSSSRRPAAGRNRLRGSSRQPSVPSPSSAAIETQPPRHLHRRGMPGGRLIRRVGSASKTILAVVGFGTIASLYVEEKLNRDATNDKILSTSDEGEKKKRVLVLPFDRMRIVEHHRDVWKKSKDALTRRLEDAEGRTIEIEARELVELIHAAAADPTITALYGTFGQGEGVQAGFGQIEEIRDAIRVFNESHRVHRDPNVHHDPVFAMARNGDPKPSYAFANTFERSSSKEYYLASAFTHVHLQPRGRLNLFGLATSNFFLRPAFEKYGVKVHAFKHGKYKTAPNSATEKGYTKEHLERTKSILTSINKTIWTDILRSRSLDLDQSMWQTIQNYGTLTALNAKEIGLVDHLPSLCPLNDLLLANKDDDANKEMKEKWSNELDTDKFDKFDADDTISLSEYALLHKRKKKAEESKWERFHRIKDLAEKSSATEFLLSRFGYDAPNYNIDAEDFSKNAVRAQKEKIAVVHIEGSISDAVARKVTGALRKIKKDKDVKCVVLRVNSPGGSVTASETILEESKDLPQPVICSMSNVAASGGYYVATNCQRIFALPTTVTGSIGVFSLKVDLTEFAKSYGVKVQHVSMGDHANTDNSFQPLTKKMRMNLSRNVDDIYDYFKSIVASGRKLSPDEIDAVAEGRVWTGEQAKEVGLIDELGGLSRAILYAKRHHTLGGDATVEVWPKQKTWRDLLSNPKNSSATASLLLNMLSDYFVGIGTSQQQLEGDLDIVGALLSGSMKQGHLHGILSQSSSNVMLTIDENHAVDLFLRGVSTPNPFLDDFPSTFWE